MTKLAHSIRQRLSHVVQLGSFSPQTFHISLDAAPVSDISTLSSDEKDTLSHEFAHLLHYVSSYLGLSDLRHWAEMVDAVQNPSKEGTPEEQLTALSRQVIKITRAKQILSIDDEYYYEPRTDLYATARAFSGVWSTSEVSGQLFKADGQVSDRRFWALRFFLGDEAKVERLENSFLRIPMGCRTALEHMARAIDFINAIGKRDPKDVVEEYGHQASDPELLHYYAYTHHVSQKLRVLYGPVARRYAYFTAGQLVAILAEIPFADPSIWGKLVAYARGCLNQKFVDVMKHPHPSFVFPLLVHAAIRSGEDWDNYNVQGIERRANSVLGQIGLPPLTDLRRHSDHLYNSVTDIFSRSAVGREVLPLLAEMKEYSDRLSWAERIVSPMKPGATALPIPIVFADGSCLDGEKLGITVSDALSKIAGRCNELCRFPVFRDVVDE